MDRPFIIFTLQRTGGTNFTFRLNALSQWDLAKQHEPFNTPRIYGAVTRSWIKERDRNVLESSMAQIVSLNENIKHCVEMVPPEISDTLIDASVKANYRYLFLYREDPVARILSAEYAQRTKVWGPSHVDKVTTDASAFETPLDVGGLVARETECITRLNMCWGRLLAAGATPVAISYEELYGVDETRAFTALSRVLAALLLSRGEQFDGAMLKELRSRGDQNTRDRYNRFKGMSELRAMSKELPAFSFANYGCPTLSGSS